MSSFRYDNASLLFGTKQLNWETAVLSAALVSANYGALKGADTLVSNIPAAAILARSGPMTNCTIQGGVCAGLIPQFNALAATVQVAAVVIYQDTGNDATSSLIYYSSDGLGFPFLPVGINYFVTYDQSNGGWFEL